MRLWPERSEKSREKEGNIRSRSCLRANLASQASHGKTFEASSMSVGVFAESQRSWVGWVELTRLIFLGPFPGG